VQKRRPAEAADDPDSRVIAQWVRLVTDDAPPPTCFRIGERPTRIFAGLEWLRLGSFRRGDADGNGGGFVFPEREIGCTRLHGVAWGCMA